MNYESNHKCANCNFQFGDHRNTDHACPLGARHRVMGFINYSPSYFFRPILPTVSREITFALRSIIGDDYTDKTLPTHRDRDPHVLALLKAVRALEADNRALRAELKEKKRWKSTSV